MKTGKTVIGIVVVAALAAGVWWTSTSRRMGMAPTAATVPETSFGADLPDVSLHDASVDAAGATITMAVSPNPPVAFAKTRVRVRADVNGTPALLEQGRVTFEMEMPMGDHRYTLVAASDGWLEADVALPRCMSGRRRWVATVDGQVAGTPRTARFRLDLAVPKE